MHKRFILLAAGYLLIVFLSGCTMVKEAGKGLAGVSTQVLEDKRKDAIKKSFALDYDNCYNKVKIILNKNKGEDGPYIYAQDSAKKMIATYLSPADTTPVGIFFSPQSASETMIEVSSPSIYAKEEVAKMIFTGVQALVKPRLQEKKTDVEEKINN